MGRRRSRRQRAWPTGSARRVLRTSGVSRDSLPSS
jgi:hypothetical protein